MVADIGDPTGGTGTGAGNRVPEPQRDRTTGTARDSVTGEVVTLVGEMEITAEAEMREGRIVTKPTTPTKMGGKFRATVITVGEEVGRRRGNN